MINFKHKAAPSRTEDRKSSNSLPRVLVTGAENSLARYLACGLRELGYETTGQTVQMDSYMSLRRSLPVINHPLSDARFVEELATCAPEVVLLAASEPQSNSISRAPFAAFNRHADRTAMLCDVLRRHAPEAKLVLLSSTDVYGECDEPVRETTQPSPVSREGKMRKISEEIAQEFAQEYKLDLSILRIASAYGPGLRANPVYDLLEKLLGPKTAHLTAPLPAEARRDLVHAGDVLQAVRLMIEKNYSGILNIATGQSLPVREIVTQLCAITEQPLPAFAEHTPHGEPLIEQVNVDQLLALGFQPQVPLIEGLRGFASWWSGLKAA
ncbi:MAG: NAD(P)-dependent oxidoreductase [Calditrichaeota bacterium]|nr:NAD(P)-dependent oxidoreductase [Calditrichota bacterium]